MCLVFCFASIPSSSWSYTGRGFLYSGGSYIELLPSGWSEAWAMGINDSGAVVGSGYVVVPEPVSSILFVTGGTLLAGRKYIKRKRNRRIGRIGVYNKKLKQK